MVRPWRDLAAQTDAAVDAQFGELARLVPMRSAGYGEAARDPDRDEIQVTGTFVAAGDLTLGLAGDRAGTQMVQSVAVENLFFSVTEDQLTQNGKFFDPRQGDRLVLLAPERKGETYEINRVPPAATGRVRMTLVDIPEPLT